MEDRATLKDSLTVEGKACYIVHTLLLFFVVVVVVVFSLFYV